MGDDTEEKSDRWYLAVGVFFMIFLITLNISELIRNGASPLGPTLLQDIAPCALMAVSMIVIYSSRLWRSSIARGASGIGMMLSLLLFAATTVLDLFNETPVTDAPPSNSAPLLDRATYVVDAVLFWPGTSILLVAVFLGLIGYSVFNDAFGPDRTMD
jgi:hypothetical protein